MARAMALCKVAFCTDGDWVAKNPGKLRHLVQGADERVVGSGAADQPPVDLLFTGSQIHGGKRVSFLEECREVYGDRFRMVGHRPRERMHGRRLANLIASAKIVVAPDGPCTDRYWSNRVYLTLGFGGFMVHPFCSGLVRGHSNGGPARGKDGYVDNMELVCYTNRKHFHSIVREYLKDDEGRARIAAAGLKATLERHLYRHRCEELIAACRKELGL